MKPLPQPPLLLITDRHQAAGGAGALEDVVRAFFAGGGRWVSLREKDLEPTERMTLLKRLADLGSDCGATVGVHADVEAAIAAGRALHLPAGVQPGGVRRVVPPGTLVGASCHSMAEVQAAAGDGANYVTLSPVYESPSKPGYGPALGLEYLGEVSALVDLPVIALGGITPARVSECLAAGAAGVAVMGEIMRAGDPSAVTRSFIDSLSRGG